MGKQVERRLGAALITHPCARQTNTPAVGIDRQGQVELASIWLTIPVRLYSSRVSKSAW
jgi:hypothetical protein